MISSRLNSHADQRSGAHPPRPGDDLGLIARVLAGDPVAERTFYDAHVDSVYRLAFRVTRDAELARDFTQEAFIRAFDRIGQFRGDASISTWLRRVTMSVVLNGLERVNTRRARELSLDEVEVESEPVHTDSLDLKERLEAALATLPASQRGVIVMHDVEGFTHQEIAEALGITVSSSKVRLFRARAKLRVVLADFAEEWR
ncbi:MAG TPA: RNA polymerase sigma factor [Gemmatimonadaceae bacterium]|jgi:RNA polymerase sigma-70 factor (ECF subfamily)|nr:RNA polymerase sigma factor [Gemmatimonadaceae bacterium]